MKKNKKLLLFLALNSLATSFAGTSNQINVKYDKLYNNMIKNIETGKPNGSNFKLIQDVLNKRNQELKDLYLQGDYIVKPEYLEWQVFFSGFYNEKNNGGSKETKPYKLSQSVKEIDLGMRIPQIDVKSREMALDISAITPPKNINISSNIEIPQEIVVKTKDIPMFNFEVPTITKPNVFSPIPLNFSASGFAQTNYVGVNTGVPSGWDPHYVILNNSSATSDTNGTKITINNNNYEIENKFTWSGVNDTISLNGTYGQTGLITTPTSVGGGGTGNIGNAYRYAFANIVASNVTLTGDWEFKNNVTIPSLGLGLGNTGNIGITRFAATSHGFGMRDKNIEFILNGTLKVTGSESGHITIVFENQYYDLLPSKITNNATVTIEGGKRVFVASLMNEGGNKCNLLYWGENPADPCRGPVITKVPLKESTYTNNGKIIMKNTESIGIDFGSYYNIGTPLVVYVRPGEMELQGSSSYAIRVPNIFSTYKDYFKETVINGETGLIKLEGQQNIGISLIRRISESTDVTSFNGIPNSSSIDPIGNIRNLRFLLNGNENIGILRNVNYATQDIALGNSDIIITDGNVQDLGFGSESENSTLIRSDRAKIILNKNLDLDAAIELGKGNNIVMTANDSTTNNTNPLYKAVVENRASIIFRADLSKTTGLLSVNGGNLINSGNIQIESQESNGIVVLENSTGSNTGNILVSGEKSLGVYNTGTFTMTSGTIDANGDQSIGIFSEASNNKTNLNGGVIKSSNGGISLFTGDNSTINLNGTSLEANDKGLLMYTYKSTAATTPTGHINITGTASATINAGGTAFYLKGDPSDITSFINNTFTGTGVLNLNMAGADSRLFILDDPSNPITLSSATGTAVSSLIPASKVNIIGTDYKPYAVFKGQLIVDQNVDLDNTNDPYNRLDFFSSKTTVNSGVVISGTDNTQSAIAQRNYTGTTGRDEIKIINNGIINQTGQNAIGIVTDFGNIENNGTISGTGDSSVGIYGANGTLSKNTGTIEVGNSGIGIYGSNLLSATAPDYGNKFIEIENAGIIKSTGVTAGSFGIYSKNSDLLINTADAKITLSGTSDIDVSSAQGGVGIYSERSTVTGGGKVTVGEKSTGMYLSESNVNLNGIEINLNGDDSVGVNLDRSNISGNATFNVDGERVALLNLNSTTPINSYINYGGFTVNSTANSSYVGGNVTNAGFYTNGVNTVNNNGTLVMGKNSVILLDTGTNITAGNNSVIGIADGTYNGSIPFTFTGAGAVSNKELVNKGTVTAGDNSAVLYAKNNAKVENIGNITVGKDSVGLYGEIVNDVLNTGNITIGENSKGIYLKEAILTSDLNTGKILSTSDLAIGIYSEYSGTTPTLIKTSNEIDLSGDKSIGLYVTGSGAQNAENSNTIKIGDSTDENSPSIGIYSNSANNNITNDGTITVGKNSLAIYSTDGNILNNGTLNIGENGVGIYSDGGNVNISNTSNINIGNNSAIGVYGINGANIQNDSNNINIANGSYGFIVESGSNLTNNGATVLGDNGIFVYGNGAGTIINNTTGQITATGSDNIIFYTTNGGTIVNNANIIANTGTGNIGVYNSNGNIINTGSISVGDSILAYDTNGTLDSSNSKYSVGLYGENSNIENHGNIDIGKNSVGLYIINNATVAKNYGDITAGTASDPKTGAVGIFADKGVGIENHGNITLYGDGVVGIAGTKTDKITNYGTVSVTGTGAIGIYTALNTIVDNQGTIDVSGANGVGIIAPSGKIINSGTIIFSNGAVGIQESNQYPLPELINAGIIRVNGHFDNTGMDISIKPDLSTMHRSVVDGVDFVMSSGSISANSITITDTVKILPDFSQGTNAKVYKLEDVFITGNISSPTNKLPVVSKSLTWDATPNINDITGNIDVYMQKIDYHNFTEGLWIDSFGISLDNNYFDSTGDAGKIYDKLDLIEDESEFRRVMGSLAGNVYANMNQREETIAEVLGTSLNLLQDSKNNTKENVKVNIIAGKGTLSENTDGVVGYDYETTGVLALREVERTYKHTFGYSLGYLHSNFEFKDGNNSEEDADTIQLGAHSKYRSNDWILRNDLTGRVSIHNIDRNLDWSNAGRSEMNGKYEAYSITSDNNLGKELSLGKNATVTPYGGLEVIYVTRPTFTEKGLESLEVKGNDAWSVKPKVGVELKASTNESKNGWKLKGALDVSYGYELADLNEREYAKLTAVEDDYHKLSKPEENKGVLKTKAIVGVEIEDRYGIFLTGEYSVGEHSQDDYRAGVTLKAVF